MTTTNVSLTVESDGSIKEGSTLRNNLQLGDNDNTVNITWTNGTGVVSFKIEELDSRFDPRNSNGFVTSFTTSETNGDGKPYDYKVSVITVTANPRITNGNNP